MKHPRIRQLIREVQSIVNVTEDGLPGPDTEAALDHLMREAPVAEPSPSMIMTLLRQWLCANDPVTRHLYKGLEKEKVDTAKYIIHTPQRFAPPQKPKIEACDAPWLDWALQHLGEKEDPSKNNNPFILSLWEAIGIEWTHTTDIDSEVPWCAAFVGAALALTGYQHTGSGLARSYLEFGIPLKEFQRGCVLIWPRGNNPNAGHVDLGVRMIDEEIVQTVGGNVSDQVTLRNKHIKKAIGMRLPVTREEAA